MNFNQLVMLLALLVLVLIALAGLLRGWRP